MPSRYTPPQQAPIGAWAKHIHARRKEWDWSQTRGFRESRIGLGLGENSRAAYVAIDLGQRQPTPGEAIELAKLYGWPVTSPDEEAPATDLTALVAAIHRQAAALEERNRLDREAIAALSARLEQVEEGQAVLSDHLGERISALELRVPAARPSGTSSGGSGSGAVALMAAP